MKTLLLGIAMVVGLTAQSPAPLYSTAPVIERTALVTCASTPLYIWDTRSSRPYRSYTSGNMRNGQRVTIISGVRSTLSGFDLYETDIPVVETEPYGRSAHYWIRTDCIPPAAHH